MGKDSSAVADLEPLEVLVCLHNNFDLCDMAGPVEVLQAAQHNMKDDCKQSFSLLFRCLPLRVNANKQALHGAPTSHQGF